MRRSPVPFVVLTSPRSGSGWLIDMLSSHPEVVAYAELFHLERRTAPGYGASDIPYFEPYLDSVSPWTTRARLYHRAALLGRVYAGRPGARAVGFKLMYDQAQAHRGLLELLSLRRARVVHLTRANLLEALISWQVARETGIYHTRRGEIAPRTVVSLDAEGLHARLAQDELAVLRARSRLERLRLTRLEVSYEELVAHREETLTSVLGFLGVEPRLDLLDSRLVRSSPSRHLELVENADEVRATLAGTRFEWMLGDAVQTLARSAAYRGAA
jgi:LPS sulfotransferase NodH